MITTAEVIAAAKECTLENGEAIYLVGDEVVLGKDGCQPSNSLCLAIFPVDDLDWSEVANSVDEYVASRLQL